MPTAKKKGKKKKAAGDRGYATGATPSSSLPTAAKEPKVEATAPLAPPPAAAAPAAAPPVAAAPAAADQAGDDDVLLPDGPEMIECARYGEDDNIKLYLEAGTPVNFTDQGGSTALHKAAANGHFSVVRLLIKSGAHHTANESGNLPLHWAVQNQHVEVVKELVTKFPKEDQLDVLAKNTFGKSCITEAFARSGGKAEQITKYLLEHASAAALDKEADEKEAKPKRKPGSPKKKAGTGAGAGAGAVKSGASPSKAKVIQTTHVRFGFSSSKDKEDKDGSIVIRQLGLEWVGAAFGDWNNAADDTTGCSIWSDALILSRWVVDLAAATPDLFNGTRIMELGAGCGVSGLAVCAHTAASKVVFTDLMPHVVENLQHNVHANADIDKLAAPLPAAAPPPAAPAAAAAATAACSCVSGTETSVFALDWCDPKSWPEGNEGSFDVVVGSGLVYQEGITSTLAQVVSRLLKPGTGVFLHVSAKKRDGLPAFEKHMANAGFTLAQQEAAPESYKANPITGDSADSNAKPSGSLDNLFDLYFQEMQTQEYLLCKFIRGAE